MYVVLIHHDYYGKTEINSASKTNYLLNLSAVKEKPAKFIWSMESTSWGSGSVSLAGWNVKSSSKLLASPEDFCMYNSTLETSMIIVSVCTSLHCLSGGQEYVIEESIQAQHVWTVHVEFGMPIILALQEYSTIGAF